MANTTHSVTYKVRNTDAGTTVSPVETKVSGQDRNGTLALATSLYQALGFALEALWLFLKDNSQFPLKNCEIEIEGVTLPKTSVATLKKSRGAYEAGFPILRESIYSDLALSYPDTWGKDYMRRTDVNGVFKNTSNFTASQIGNQTVERIKMVRFTVALEKQDAADSVWAPGLKEKRDAITAQRQEARKALLLAQKSKA